MNNTLIIDEDRYNLLQRNLKNPKQLVWLMDKVIVGGKVIKDRG